MTFRGTTLYLSVADCAVCEDGFAPGIAYACRECSGGITRSAVGLTIALGLAGLLVAAQLFYYLGRVMSNDLDEGTEEVARNKGWGQKFSACSSLLVNMLPLTAIKIVVTVWQIISQV